VFAYQPPGGDEALAPSIEERPQPLDEAVYASAYAKQQPEIPPESPAESSRSANQSASFEFAPSNAPDEATIERPTEMARANLVSSEVAGETLTEIAAADFASSDAVKEVWTEAQPEAPMVDVTPSFTSSTAPDGAMSEDRYETVRDYPAALNRTKMFDENPIESQPEIAIPNFTPSEAIGEARSEGQTEIAGAETQMTQEKQEEIKS
jgi:hypothetical protein